MGGGGSASAPSPRESVLQLPGGRAQARSQPDSVLAHQLVGQKPEARRSRTLASRSPRTPLAAKLIAGAVAAFALSPIDLIPDFIPSARLSRRSRDRAVGSCARRSDDTRRPNGRVPDTRDEPRKADQSPHGHCDSPTLDCGGPICRDLGLGKDLVAPRACGTAHLPLWTGRRSASCKVAMRRAGPRPLARRTHPCVQASPWERASGGDPLRLRRRWRLRGRVWKYEQSQ